MRQGRLRFALPFTSGPRPGIDDYLPAPHGLPGFAAPVEQLVPALTPYLELEDGRTIAACDGADSINLWVRHLGIGEHIDPNVKKENSFSGIASVRADWSRWALVNLATTNELPYGQPENYVDPGLHSEVICADPGKWQAACRAETISASHPITIQRLRLAFPSTALAASPPARKKACTFIASPAAKVHQIFPPTCTTFLSRKPIQTNSSKAPPPLAKALADPSL